MRYYLFMSSFTSSTYCFFASKMVITNESVTLVLTLDGLCDNRFFKH